MLQSAPTVIASLSARITAVGHTDVRAPIVTLPITTASGWMNAFGSMLTRNSPESRTCSEGKSKPEVQRRRRHGNSRIVRHRRGDADAKKVRHVVRDCEVDAELRAGRCDPVIRERARRSKSAARAPCIAENRERRAIQKEGPHPEAMLG